MSKNPKINLTQEDEELYLQNVFTQLIVENKYPQIIKRAKKLVKKFLKENVDK